MEVEYKDKSWDFCHTDTKIYTHCFHSYPAMMIPQVVDRLLEKWGQGAKLLFDPYCGTGTSLVEANIKGINAIGTDLNPLARLIARAKTTPINLQKLDLYLKDFSNFLFSVRFRAESVSVVCPNFNNIDFWFKKETIGELAIIKEYISKIEDNKVADFFKVAFSETVRDSSLTRNGEFKLFRMSRNRIRNFNPDVFGLMESKLARNRRGLQSFMERRRGDPKSSIYSFNTIDDIPEEVINDESVDIVITSPPYGDSRTTVAYGQFSRLANQWLDFREASQLDKRLMGGVPVKNIPKFECEGLNQAISQIAEKDRKRAGDVVSFYTDLEKSIDSVSKVIKRNGYACYVVGNRQVKGITLPTDKIIAAIFERREFKHIETIIRNIPEKRMPSRNSPTNIVGKLGTTINNEYIVALEKC